MIDWLHSNNWLGGDFSYRLVVTLLHFIWQAAILGAVAHTVILMLQRRNVRHAYGINVASLASMVLIATFTFAIVKRPEATSTHANSEQAFRRPKGYEQLFNCFWTTGSKWTCEMQSQACLRLEKRRSVKRRGIQE